VVGVTSPAFPMPSYKYIVIQYVTAITSLRLA
jgi:hypothetical protein